MNIIHTDFQWTQPLVKRTHTDTLILHHAEAIHATVEEINRWHVARGWSGIGYHYYVRKDGSVYQGRPEDVVGAHAGSSSGYNSRSIGICFEGNYMVETMQERQLAAGLALVRQVEARYGNRLNIIGHRDVTSTDCPGKNFPMERFKSYKAIKEEQDMTKDEVLAVLREQTPVYKTLADIPAWAKPTVQKLIAKKLLGGDGDGLNLDESALRVFVVNDRAGL